MLLSIALLVFLATDTWFEVLEDETAIVTAARQPPTQTVGLFLHGEGQHEHPPLSDVLLHYWLPLGADALWSLRLPSVLFYLSGLLVLAFSARKLGGDVAFEAMLCIGLLWPFGFHFGRLVGWYTFCFFLVATLTWTYLRYVERPRWQRLVAFVVVATLLVYSNYYGWVLVACLAIDIALVKRHKTAARFLLATFGTLALAYVPLVFVFLSEVAATLDPGLGGPPLASTLLNAMYNLYSLFVSESVAPWFWSLSIPASVGIAASIVLAIVLLPKEHRWFLAYFALAFGGMVVLGKENTKRLLFVSCWLLLSFALALSNTAKPAARRSLVVALVFVATIGWVGIVARAYYAAPHFIEPWADVADGSALLVREGGVVISNSPSFMFEINYSLRRFGLLPLHWQPGWVEHPRVYWVDRWKGEDHIGKVSNLLFVKGVSVGLENETEQVATWLREKCALVSTQQLVPDSGYALKTRFFGGYGQPPYRISLQHYDCSKAP